MITRGECGHRDFRADQHWQMGNVSADDSHLRELHLFTYPVLVLDWSCSQHVRAFHGEFYWFKAVRPHGCHWGAASSPAQLCFAVHAPTVPKCGITLFLAISALRDMEWDAFFLLIPIEMQMLEISMLNPIFVEFLSLLLVLFCSLVRSVRIRQRVCYYYGSGPFSMYLSTQDIDFFLGVCTDYVICGRVRLEHGSTFD